MAAREIVLYPNPILKKVCRAVERVDDQVLEVVQDLSDTLEASPGVGVAAPQIGFDLRIFAVDVGDKGHGRLLLINPELVRGEGRKIGREGCLSIPEFTANVARYTSVVISALDPQGERRVIQSSGFEAVCLQHELDHLDGILFLDRVACLKADVFKRKGAKPRFSAKAYEQKLGGNL